MRNYTPHIDLETQSLHKAGIINSHIKLTRNDFDAHKHIESILFVEKNCREIIVKNNQPQSRFEFLCIPYGRPTNSTI